MSVPSLIEQWFPAAMVGAESIRDGSAAKKPPVNRLHVWWARRPLTTSRAAVVASLLPAWPTPEMIEEDARAEAVLAALVQEFPGGQEEYRRWFLEALGILGDPVAARKAIAAAVAIGERTKGNAYGYDRAYTVTPDQATIDRIQRLARCRADVQHPPSVLDPFSGGGSIPFEAARYGCSTTANELNPVAAAILNGTIVLPSERGLPFAVTLEHWGKVWSDRVAQRLDRFFPREQPDEKLAYIWAHAVPCPSTGRPTPLAPNYWLSRGRSGRDVAVALEPVGSELRIDIVNGADAAEHGNRATYKRGSATSVWTGQTFGGEYIREKAQAGLLTEMLLAVVVTKPGRQGGEFRPPSGRDTDAMEAAKKEVLAKLPTWEVEDLVPTEEFQTVTRLRSSDGWA